MAAHLVRSNIHPHISTSTGIQFRNSFGPDQGCFPLSMNDHVTQNPRPQDTRSFNPSHQTTEMLASIPQGYTLRDRSVASRITADSHNSQQRAVYKAANPTASVNHGSNASAHGSTAVAAMSPISNARVSQDNDQSEPRQETVVSNIAPSFQIPRSINDSGGSLSELAAEIACLFWFESAELLQLIENSPDPVLGISRPLIVDAHPTTGFRKWVTTILSTTLVAQNVVLLALLFVYRLKKLNPTVRGKPGSEYRLLTIALMLGNKFLDDNTYTNKTWAEVSGINVSEVHVMEVEFLSNMKYCLHTSADDWAKWQMLLGRFASYIERSKNPLPQILAASHSSSSLGFPHGFSLPSPPASAQASPPYTSETAQNGSLQSHVAFTGSTPAPSPHFAPSESQPSRAASRKRSLDDSMAETPKKRSMPYSNDPSPRRPIPSVHNKQNLTRLPPPNLAISTSNVLPPAAYPRSQQLPPMNALHPIEIPPLVSPEGPQMPTSMVGQFLSRQQSPHLDSLTISPAAGQPRSASSLHPPIQISPSYFLQQRSSPYRPVHHVSTLLYPPSSTALQQKGQIVEQDQMHYQPLGKSAQHRQTGRLPYVSQNVWMDRAYPQAMTPVHQWPSFNSMVTRQPFPKQ